MVLHYLLFVLYYFRSLIVRPVFPSYIEVSRLLRLIDPTVVMLELTRPLSLTICSIALGSKR